MGKDISDQSTSLITAKTPLESCPVASLFVTHGELFGREIPLSRETIFIGRSKNNNLVFTDKSVSRKHAVINMIDGEYVISDLDSLKGVYINGKKIKESTLRPGDVVNIGENRMQFRLITPTGAWVVPHRRKWLWVFVLILILGLSVGVLSWYNVGKVSKEKLPDEISAQIEMHYKNGVQLFNRDHNLKAARKEWEQILELDPEGKSPYSSKAAKLLRATETNAPK